MTEVMSSSRSAGAPAGRRSPGVGPALAAALVGFFMITMDAVIVKFALPTIGRDLGSGMTGLQWVVDGYTLMFAAHLLSAGVVSDRLGARRAFGAGLAVFVAASVAGGLAPALDALEVARFVQGAAAAVMMPSSMALIGQAYPEPAKRARAVAVWAMGGAIASSSGLVLGGLLTLVSWRSIFFINVPVGAVAIFGALLAQPATFMQGLRASLLLAAGVALATAVASLLLRPSNAGALAGDVRHRGSGRNGSLAACRCQSRRPDCNHLCPSLLPGATTS